MKLAEALIIRADLQKKFASLRERVGVNCKVQEGETPSENPRIYSGRVRRSPRVRIDRCAD